MENDYQQLKMQVETMSKKLDAFLDIYYRTNFPDKAVMTKQFSILDNNIVFEGTATSKIDVQSAGLSLGNSASQKLSLYGETPVVQASAISAPSTPGAAYVQSEAQSAVNAINSIRTALSNIGITA